jgi:hypothetical protein
MYEKVDDRKQIRFNSLSSVVCCGGGKGKTGTLFIHRGVLVLHFRKVCVCVCTGFSELKNGGKMKGFGEVCENRPSLFDAQVCAAHDRSQIIDGRPEKIRTLRGRKCRICFEIYI